MMTILVHPRIGGVTGRGGAPAAIGTRGKIPASALSVGRARRHD
ncbi:MAG: hypothetical protein AVDCRST_MAG59-605 [uncultured Thermomicrobiales bacterium]|uniref:Uncharacterized protein n=1 Tax=uncultured Thermomicrobiales bacterium TaxID=1645740 RepID=A0A6J4U216_9BACT|nr:MAG: hypothetical protein AVDCRST_MAG59-605 [uncultured Thermomicrobiales bacterium]